MTRLDSSNPEVPGSSENLKQVFLNLMIKARDAMKTGGTLTVRTRTLDGQVVTTVCDTGPEFRRTSFLAYSNRSSRRRNPARETVARAFGVLRYNKSAEWVDSLEIWTRAAVPRFGCPLATTRDLLDAMSGSS